MIAKEANNLTKAILQEMCKPTWNDERDGVYIPLLNIVIDKTNLREGADKDGELKWDDAMEAVKKAGKRMLTKEEWQLIRYWKDEINCLLREHGGDEIEGYFWCCSEYSRTDSWYVHFNSGVTYNYDKYFTNYVRPVS